MALLWIEGFEGFGTALGGAPSPTGIVGRKYPNSTGESSMNIESGRGGTGYCVEFNLIANILQSPPLTTDSTCVLGLAWKFLLDGEVGAMCYLMDGISYGVNIMLNASGTLSVRAGSTVLGTTTNVVTVNTWYYFELKVLCNATTGTVDLYVNGSNWLTLSGVDTKAGANNYHDSFLLYGQPKPCMFDDVYFLDGTGSVNNDVLGNRKVVAISPNAAGDDSDWTPSAGSNYQNVDDGALLDEDTTYNETSTNAHQDLFNYGNLPANVSSVDGIQINTETRVTAGTMDISAVSKTGTTTDTGSAVTVTSTSYVSTVRVIEEDPDTATAWTPGGVDGAQFGVLANT